MKQLTLYALSLLLLLLGNPALSGEEHADNEHAGHEHDEHGEENRIVHIDEAIAEKMGIKIALAESQIINQNIIAYGKLNTGPEQLSHIRARYSGLIKSVSVNIGDQIVAGATLAEVESNESLRNYRITSPINGIVVQRHANTGEVTQDQILFSIANFDTLWAELRIYPSQRHEVKPAQTVHFHVDDHHITGEISHIVPSLDNPFQLARIKIANSELDLLPGLLIEGNISISQTNAAIAVSYDAVQTIDEKRGVFVQQDTNYYFQPLILGQADHDYIEVLAGLEAGTRYVSHNSYVLKADLEKSGAEHQH